MTDDDATRTSEALAAVIRRAIADAGGWIPFSRFMELALYAPGLGYYSAGATKLGRGPADGSDFTTAPELSPLFGRTLARPVAAILAAGGDTICELGGGSGRLAADLLAELEVLDALPTTYLLLDVSADLRERQHATLVREVPHLLPCVGWLSALPDRLHGAVIANEVLDAVPVELVVSDGAEWSMRGVVALDEAGFGFADRPLPAAFGAGAALPPARRFAPGYQTERHPAACALVASVVERMTPQSVALFIDYGFPASEYLHPQRAGGTLMTHRAHRTGTDPFVDVGLQDITAHVDFSEIAAAAVEAGGTIVGYTSQAAFLIDAGIVDLMRGGADATGEWTRQTTALQKLLSEAEMGELFKVLAVGRNRRDLPGLRASNRRDSLAMQDLAWLEY